MASEDVTVIAPGQSGGTNAAVSSQIGVFVTADVRVVQYGSSESLGNHDGTRCTVVTSLSTVINETLNRVLRSQPCSGSKECVAGTMKTLVLTKEECDQPVVRRSKKHTHLNSVNITDESAASRRAQIDRTVLLPYLGCTRRFEPSRSYSARVFAKSSKSWEAVGKLKEGKIVKPFRSQSFNTGGSLNNTSSEVHFLDYQDLVPNKQLVYSLGEYELLNTGFNLPEEAVRSFYLIKTPTSAANEFTGRKNAVKKPYFVGQENYNSMNPEVKYLNKNKNIAGLAEEIFAPSDKLSCKTTRNVSIMHRPKTRDKSTSTTCLGERNAGQNDNTQGLLLPYVSNGRDFPSEIVLKLIPKAEALKNSSNETTNKANRSDSSEVQLLAPILNTETKHKKKSGKSFWNCFSNQKSTDDDTLDDSTDKEVYYPSIVEVHNKNKKFQDQPNSDFDNSICSFYNREKTNKQS